MAKRKHWTLVIEVNGCDMDTEFYGTQKEADEYAEEWAEQMDGIYRYSIDRSPRWSDTSLRLFCINHNFYTCGDNAQYGEMLTFVAEHDPTTTNVRMVAIDIIAHSDKYSIYEEGDIDFIADWIWNEVIS